MLRHFGVDQSARCEASPEVRALALDPRCRIEAIKAYWRQSGASLKDAVEVVDALAKDQPATPD